MCYFNFYTPCLIKHRMINTMKHARQNWSTWHSVSSVISSTWRGCQTWLHYDYHLTQSWTGLSHLSWRCNFFSFLACSSVHSEMVMYLFAMLSPLVYFWLCQQLTHKNDPTKKEAANLSTSLQAAPQPHLVLVKTRPHKEDTHTHMMCAQGNGEMHSIKSLWRVLKKSILCFL